MIDETSKHLVLRVFPRRTTYTPSDELVAIGEPGLFEPLPFDEIHVSCVFTWDLSETHRLVKAWADRYPKVVVKLGGPACDDPGSAFVSGRYTRLGVSISSRGCPHTCPWCLVPKREGKLRLLDISPGWIIQDNNVTAFSRTRFKALARMLTEQPVPAMFHGGLEAARLKDWHVDALKTIRIGQLFFAADTDSSLKALRRAGALLKDLGRRKKRCYVLLGYNQESLDKGEARLEAVWDAGFLPFAQLYKDEKGGPAWSKEDKRFARKWQRPAIMFAMHKEVCVP